MRLLLPLLALALVAGCATPAEDVEPAAVDAAPDAASNAAATLPDATAAAENVTLPMEHPFRHEGKVPVFAEACSWGGAAGTCIPLPPTADFRAMSVEPSVPGALVSGTVTATWTPTDPTHQEMVLWAYSYGGESWVSHGWVMGASGLVLELQDVEEHAEDRTLRIGLGPVTRGAFQQGVGAWATASPTEQPFTLEGILLVAHATG